MGNYDAATKAVAQVADCKPSELTEESCDFYGLRLFSLGNTEYAVGTDEEADSAAQEYVTQSVWAFQSSFLASFTGLPEEVFTALQDKCEDANDTFLTLINEVGAGIEEFTSKAISSDGRGHFLSGYDGKEEEATVKGALFYVYRVN